MHLHRVKAGGLYVEGGVCNAVLGSSCRSAPLPLNSDSSPENKQLQQHFNKIMLKNINAYAMQCAFYLDVLYKLLCVCID